MMIGFSEWTFGRGLRGISNIGFNFLKFHKEFDIALIDLEVFIVEFIGKGFAFGAFNLLHLNISVLIELQLCFSFLSDLG